MKIEVRHWVGLVMLIPFLPFLIIGFVTYWCWLYTKAGFEIGEIIYGWLEEKLN